jgi:hypothetical protein
VTIYTETCVTVTRPDIVAVCPEREPSQYYRLTTASGKPLHILKEALVELTLGRSPLVSELANCEVISQAKSVSKRGCPKAPSPFHGSLGPMFYPIDKVNVISGCLENKFRALDLCDCDRRRHVEAGVEALLTTVDEDKNRNSAKPGGDLKFPQNLHPMIGFLSTTSKLFNKHADERNLLNASLFGL